MTYSVLMSVYKNDDPELLKEALESIYEKQTRKPDEIVIVCDGPLTEGLDLVLEEFIKDKSNIVQCLRLETNQGLGEALRQGSRRCTGDYIFRMDSDDLSDPRRFEVQAAFVEAHPEIDVLGTDIAEFCESLDEDMRVRACPTTHDEIAQMAKRRNPMNHVTVCMKRQALIDCGGYEEVALLEDYYLWLKMITAGCQLANIHESMVYVRLGNDFNNKRGSKKRVKGWRVLQKYMHEHGMISRWQMFTNMVCIYGFVYCPSFVRKLAYERFLRG